LELFPTFGQLAVVHLPLEYFRHRGAFFAGLGTKIAKLVTTAVLFLVVDRKLRFFRSVCQTADPSSLAGGPCSRGN